MEDVLDVYNPPCQDSCRRPKPHVRWCGRNTGAIPLSPTDRGFAELYTVAPENAWFKIKGKNKLTGKQLSIIQTLAQWREKTAQFEDRPKSWLLRDQLLFDLAKLQPETVVVLANVRGIKERAVNRYGKELRQLITASKNRAPLPLYEKDRPTKKTQQQEAILDILTALVRIRAEENSLNPSILATRKDLEVLLFNDDDECPLLHDWRFTMAGRELVGLLKGELLLGVESERLAIIEKEALESGA
jgi:ribonuclease D